jgi:hypothetical protein
MHECCVSQKPHVLTCFFLCSHCFVTHSQEKNLAAVTQTNANTTEDPMVTGPTKPPELDPTNAGENSAGSVAVTQTTPATVGIGPTKPPENVATTAGGNSASSVAIPRGTSGDLLVETADLSFAGTRRHKDEGYVKF